MIKVCYIIGQLTKGGAEKQLFGLVRGINREKFDPTVISLSRGGYWSEEIRKAGVPVFELERKKNFEFKRLIDLIRLLRSLRPHVVHTYLFSANSYGRLAALVSGVPVIIASERNCPEIGKDKTRYQMLIDRLLARFSQAIICNSQAASRTLTGIYSYDMNKVFAVHNGIDCAGLPESGPPAAGSKEKVPVVGTIGRLCAQKNHSLFLLVAKEVLSLCKTEIKFLIVGEGKLRRDLEEQARRLGIDGDVIFAGERHDIREILQGMDVFVMTSLYEGLSNAIMEAMMAGLPVVATDVGGNGELVVDGETGFLCPCKDAKLLAQKIAGLLSDETTVKRLGENGRSKIINEFRIETMVKSTEDIYLALAGMVPSFRTGLRKAMLWER
jgi:glycosyltransferase involved in cell wall biosynthesis